MQCLSKSKMCPQGCGYTAAFPFSWGEKNTSAVVEDKISPQSQTWQASIYMVSILC